MRIAILLLCTLLIACAVDGDGASSEGYINPYAETCTKGLVNDPAPGSCRDYIDVNGDRVCDRSQPAVIP